ncbi:lytic transglycosylase domain-containing protein [Paludibacterium sp. B53371]|uniref:lytic transglycosylase domain-containing protein n=1 Tax=Paludibacterium sp. B53371 TaxID=2806263 RepID=UPI001C053EDF|nr:lytic transglycosylase domain-containing protein [Paludibacterium sp. B53371]
MWRLPYLLALLLVPAWPTEAGAAERQGRMAPPALLQLISQTAMHFGLDPDLLHALIRVESGYDPRARSAKGAIGLMQLIPATGSRFGATVLEDPVQNLQAGSRYLVWLLQRFDGNLPLALAAYNAGEGAVLRYGNRIPPYPETAQYVARVLRHYRAATGLLPPAQRGVLILRDEGLPIRETW